MPSLFPCFLVGLIPPLWFCYVAEPRLTKWHEGHTAPAVKKVAMEANAKAGWPQWIVT